MKWLMRFWLVLFFLLLHHPRLYSQPIEKQPFGFHLGSKKNKIRLPFQIYSNLIVVPVQLNDGPPLNFILDTGVSSTILVDPTIIKNQHLQIGRTVTIDGVGKDTPLVAHIVVGNKIQMGDVIALQQNILVLEEDILHLSEFLGITIHGLFGYDIFKNFVVTVDYQQKELILRTPKSYTYKKHHGEKLKITIEGNKAFLDNVTIRINEQEKKLKLVIDTGAGHALLLDQFNDTAFPTPQRLLHTQLGWGLNGIVLGSLGRINSVRIGRFEFKEVIASFPDEAAFGNKFDDTINRQGSIGSELLRRFKLILNYDEEYIVLKPQRSKFREKFEHDMSGMEIKATGEGLKQFIISNILPNSPSDLAGLAEGDQLMYINDLPVKEMSLNQLVKMLQKGDKHQLSILVQRNGEMFFTSLVLKRQI